MKHNLKIILSFVLLILSLNFKGYSDKKENSANPIALDKRFFSDFQKTDIIRRDLLLDELLNKILQSKGQVESVGSYERYHRRFRIIINNTNNTPSIRFYIFTDNDEYLKLLNKNDLFEFKGQFVIYTPLSSNRDSYIFDIILEDGALVVE